MTSWRGSDFGLYFFFSSRRRHTRYIGDWSSDVCSSDLFRQHKGAIYGGRIVSTIAVIADHARRRKHEIGRASCRERAKVAAGVDSVKTENNRVASDQGKPLSSIHIDRRVESI